MEQQAGVCAVSRWVHHWPGKHVALPISVLQEWRRFASLLSMQSSMYSMMNGGIQHSHLSILSVHSLRLLVNYTKEVCCKWSACVGVLLDALI